MLSCSGWRWGLFCVEVGQAMVRCRWQSNHINMMWYGGSLDDVVCNWRVLPLSVWHMAADPFIPTSTMCHWTTWSPPPQPHAPHLPLFSTDLMGSSLWIMFWPPSYSILEIYQCISEFKSPQIIEISVS